jgi:hypothetical protein
MLTRLSPALTYVEGMPLSKCQPCIPPRAIVPAGPDWIHEIKHDGYRMIVQTEGRQAGAAIHPDLRL